MVAGIRSLLQESLVRAPSTCAKERERERDEGEGKGEKGELGVGFLLDGRREGDESMKMSEMGWVLAFKGVHWPWPWWA